MSFSKTQSYSIAEVFTDAFPYHQILDHIVSSDVKAAWSQEDERFFSLAFRPCEWDTVLLLKMVGVNILNIPAFECESAIIPDSLPMASEVIIDVT